MWQIVLPAALPQIFTGLQVALPLSLIVAVVAEMVMGGYGLGGAMITASRFADSRGVFAGIVEIAVVGFMSGQGDVAGAPTPACCGIRKRWSRVRRDLPTRRLCPQDGLNFRAIRAFRISGRKIMRVLKSAWAGLAAALIANTASAQAPVKIRTSWVAPVANWASILLEKKDLARHMGKSYVMEPVRYAGTPLIITAMASGDLEIGNLAYSTLALAVQNAGMSDLRVISDEFQDGVPGYYTSEFMVLKDGPIKKVEDLKGKIIATNAAGSAVDVATQARC